MPGSASTAFSTWFGYLEIYPHAGMAPQE
jgi:hypothetical protein